MLQGTQQQKPSGITHHSGESQVDGTPGNPRLPFAFSGVVFVGLHLDTSFLASGTASCFLFFLCAKLETNSPRGFLSVSPVGRLHGCSLSRLLAGAALVRTALRPPVRAGAPRRPSASFLKGVWRVFDRNVSAVGLSAPGTSLSPRQQ